MEGREEPWLEADAVATLLASTGGGEEDAAAARAALAAAGGDVALAISALLARQDGGGDSGSLSTATASSPALSAPAADGPRASRDPTEEPSVHDDGAQYVVTGAGVERCNGVYTMRRELRDGVRCWSNANDVVLLRWRLPSGAQWWYLADLHDLRSGGGDFYRARYRAISCRVL